MQWTQLARSFAASYPLHPTLLSVFERKWQALPRFQQTRGILRPLDLWVAHAYNAGFKGAHKDPLIGETITEFSMATRADIIVVGVQPGARLISLGAFAHQSIAQAYFRMDRWRLNLIPKYWVPSYIYCEGGGLGGVRSSYAGKRAEALQILNHINVLARRQYVPPYQIAEIYLGPGDKDRSLEWWNRARNDHPTFYSFWPPGSQMTACAWTCNPRSFCAA